MESGRKRRRDYDSSQDADDSKRSTLTAFDAAGTRPITDFFHHVPRKTSSSPRAIKPSLSTAESTSSDAKRSESPGPSRIAPSRSTVKIHRQSAAQTALSARVSDLETNNASLTHQLKLEKDLTHSLNNSCTQLATMLTHSLKLLAAKERENFRSRLQEELRRVGAHVYRASSNSPEWEGGQETLALANLKQTHRKEKKNLEKILKLITENNTKTDPDSTTTTRYANDIDVSLLREIYTAKMVALSRMEATIAERSKRLKRDRLRLLKQMRILDAQDNSQLRDYQTLKDRRYQLLNMLGSGGFGEVWSAWDTVDSRKVAIKLHKVSSEWSDVQQSAYVRHAIREVDIQQSLSHPRVVEYYDRFLIDNSSFATVLEFVEGSDLDVQLKASGEFVEKEAKVICAQLLSGLRYMESKNVIHYDLKPGNIMYHRGEVKITDFGLSKIVPTGETVIDLTSQGSGTAWYLPPECFESGSLPKISHKVDVWSLGVIFFEILFNKKPFGDGISQDQLSLQRQSGEDLDLEFPRCTPSKGLSVSEEAKDFIRFVLKRDPNERPSAAACLKHPYFLPKKEGAATQQQQQQQQQPGLVSRSVTEEGEKREEEE